MKNIHLIANAHLDPVWLWRWQEGCSEAVSTFNTVEQMTAEFESFVFNHNESILYEWVKDIHPALFERIKQGAAEGRWNIMGGWYLQPDCNMPVGESIIRNIEKGRRFFDEHFGQIPGTAVNFDSFGHSRGLVQILRQAGYDSYLVCRPAANGYSFEEQDFEWEGIDGSTIIVHRSDENYNSVWGEAAKELEAFLPEKESEEVTLYLWGVGDHGGGPSRKDLRDFRDMMEADAHNHLIHSTPEAYFREMRTKKTEFPKVTTGLNPIAQGVYTSQIRVKQKHRELENEIYSGEKMAAAAHLQCGRAYPKKEIEAAVQALLFAEFHDALPGTASRPVEEDTIRLLDYGLEIMDRIKHTSALVLAQSEEPVKDGTSVILFYNPHPYDITGVFTCETGLPKQNWTTDFLYPQVQFEGKEIPAQSEKETSHFNIDWRKRVTVQATLKAGSMNRMEVSYKPLPKRPEFPEIVSEPEYVFDNGEMRVVIDTATGWLKEYSAGGKTFLTEGSMQLISADDTNNAWGIRRQTSHMRRIFQPLMPHEASEFCGLAGKVIEPVRIIEDGAVRTTIEAVFGYHNSKAYIRYQLPKKGGTFDLDVGVNFQEKEQYLKLVLRTPEDCSDFRGQVMFGHDALRRNDEDVMQKWVMVREGEKDKALAVINDGTHGVSYENRELGLTLLRSAGYTAADFTMGKTLQEEQWAPRMDQGERFYHFRVKGTDISRMEAELEREAQCFNERPYGFSYCPPGEGTAAAPFMAIDNPRVMVSALKRAEDFDGYILRLYETAGKEAQAVVSLLDGKISRQISFQPFEIKTYKVDIKAETLQETALIEAVYKKE